MTTPQQVLEHIRLAAQLNRFGLSDHCLNERMPERGVTVGDIRSAMKTATSATHQPENDRWRLAGGVDREGLPLTVIVVLVNGVLVVTVFEGE